MHLPANTREKGGGTPTCRPRVGKITQVPRTTQDQERMRRTTYSSFSATQNVKHLAVQKGCDLGGFSKYKGVAPAKGCSSEEIRFFQLDPVVTLASCMHAPRYKLHISERIAEK